MMLVHLLLVVIYLLSMGRAAPTLDVLTGKDGSFVINVNNEAWLTSYDTMLFSGNAWYSSTGKTLVLNNTYSVNGSDILGEYSSTVYSYNVRLGASSYSFETSLKTYKDIPNAVFFGQSFPQGLLNTAIGNENTPSTVFPSFEVSQSLGYLHYYLDMAGAGFSSGLFPKGYQGGYQGGPLALYDQQLNTLVFSSLTNFLSLSSSLNSSVLLNGVQGKAKEIPEGWGCEYVLVLGQGMNNAFMAWGDIMLAKYGKTRLPPTVSTVIAYLGYSTTGYYFYNPIDGNSTYGNYEETLLNFNDYSKKLGIPYRYYLLDSWWYGEEGVYGGVWMWEDSKTLLEQRFPHGLEWLHDTLGVPFVCHMGKWVSDSPYVKNSSYGFIAEKQWAVPTSFEFFDYIFGNASGWGLISLKQDHINEQILDMDATLADVTTTRTWLLNEGKGAAHHGINLEYCMDFSAVVLTSLENPTATHSRAGGDYVPAQASWQWRIGVTSMFLWAIGLYPDKDTFYTTSNEVTADHPNAPFYKFQEPHPYTHAIASSLSAGPITPSDGIGGTDKTLVMRMCATDGLLLKPDRPAINIESTWIQRAFGGGIGPQGDVITTYTQIGPFTWHYIFGVELNYTYSFLPSDLLLPINSNAYVAFLFNETSGNIQLVKFTETSPLIIPAGANYGDYSYWIAAPVLDNGWIFLGETDKFIVVSKQRVQSVTTANSVVQVEIAGQPGEQISLSFAAPSSLLVHTYQCTISSSGFSLFTMPGATCEMN